MMTPEEAAMIAGSTRTRDSEIAVFCETATAKQLAQFHALLLPPNQADWRTRSAIALELRLAEDAAENTNKLIQHTEKLTQQTDKLIKESVGLSGLTKVLIWLTIALGIFAVVQIILMVFDIWKHK